MTVIDMLWRLLVLAAALAAAITVLAWLAADDPDDWWPW